MTKKQEPLYAYAVRKTDGSLAILQSNDNKFGIEDNYRIPVSLDKRNIEAHGRILVGGSLESQLVDVSPLVESGIISPDSLIKLDEYNSKTQMIWAVNLPSKF